MLLQDIAPDGNKSLWNPDLIISGSGITVTHQAPTPAEEFSIVVRHSFQCDREKRKCGQGSLLEQHLQSNSRTDSSSEHLLTVRQ
jgi:hypothetical protein